MELQNQKDFALVEHFDTKYDDLWNMCHKGIFPCAALQYQSNIYLIDMDKNKSFLHRYDKNASKVVTHYFSGVNH